MKSEFWKIVYNRWILLISVFIPVFAVCVMFVLNIPGMSGKELYETGFLQSMYLTQNWFAVLAALYFGEEFKRSSLRSSLLCCPNRAKYLTQKLGCLFIWITVLLYITMFICYMAVLVMNPEISIPLGEFLSLFHPVFLSTVEIVLITVALTVVLRSGTIAMAVMISLLMGVGHMLLSLGEAMRMLPGISTMNTFYLMEQPGFLGKITGLICQGIFGLWIAGASFLVFVKRSVR